MEAPVYFERVSLCNALLFIKYEIFSVLTRDHLLFIIVYYCRNQILPTQFQSLFNLSKMYNGNKIVSIISLLIFYHVSKIHHFPFWCISSSSSAVVTFLFEYLISLIYRRNYH